jgi:hypothetical protein
VITHSFVSLGAQRKAATGFAAGMTPIGTSHTVLSKDGTRIGYLSLGTGPSVLVVPGVPLHAERIFSRRSLRNVALA